MDEDMWHHPATKRNIELLQSFGNRIIDVEKGELASGLIGEGRMAEPETIVEYLTEHFFRGKELSGKKILITAGPTYEAIDPVRFIGNHSSGKMGFALAEAFYLKGAEVELVTGPTHQQTVYGGIKITKVTGAEEMYQKCIAVFPSCNIAVMSAAVADYKPIEASTEKIKKTNEDLTIQLSKTKDILKSLGEQKKNGQLLVGFALETNNERAYALNKMKTKNADMIVLNSLRDKNAGFGFDTNKVTVFDKEGNEFVSDLASKQSIAADIVNIIIQKINA
jgi:phosphopantothenoylcysteine decarboxylase/phosphopantothenate--cysteine ligase